MPGGQDRPENGKDGGTVRRDMDMGLDGEALNRKSKDREKNGEQRGPVRRSHNLLVAPTTGLQYRFPSYRQITHTITLTLRWSEIFLAR
jgi:hypothetical protein